MNLLKVALTCFLFSLIIAGCQKDEVFQNLRPNVNAGKDTTFTLNIWGNDTIKLAGSATDEDGEVTAYLWSQVSGPNTATIAFPGSPVNYAVNIVAGTYVFQLMATDNWGATGVKSVTIKVLPPAIQTITFQEHNNINEAHIWGNNTNIDGSHNGAPEIGAAAWTVDGSEIAQRGLFKFNLANIPANAKIISAKLSLYSTPTPLNGNLVDANYGTNNTMLIQRVISNWLASQVKWRTQPSATTTDEIVIPHTNQRMLDLIDVNVTALVQAMVSESNYGFIIKLQNEVIYNSRLFCSSYYSDPAKHPKLIVQFSK